MINDFFAVSIRSHAKITPNQSDDSGNATFRNACQKAADHLATTIDGKQKEFESSTYANVKALLKSIQKSGYFDKAAMQSDPTTVDNQIATIECTGTDAVDTDESNHQVNHGNVTEQIHAEPAEVIEEPIAVAENNNEVYQEAPSASAVPVPTFAQPQPQPQPQQQQQQQQQPQPQPQPHTVSTPPNNAHANAQLKPLAQVPVMPGHHAMTGHGHATTVHAVEQAYFKQHQYMQQIRPLADVMSSVGFIFVLNVMRL